MLELDVDDVRRILRAARDDERLRELDRRDPGGELHRPKPTEALHPVVTAYAAGSKAGSGTSSARGRLGMANAASAPNPTIAAPTQTAGRIPSTKASAEK